MYAAYRTTFYLGEQTTPVPIYLVLTAATSLFSSFTGGLKLQHSGDLLG